jgi:hypothetical protein
VRARRRKCGGSEARRGMRFGGGGGDWRNRGLESRRQNRKTEKEGGSSSPTGLFGPGPVSMGIKKRF